MKEGGGSPLNRKLAPSKGSKIPSDEFVDVIFEGMNSNQSTKRELPMKESDNMIEVELHKDDKKYDIDRS